MALEKNTKPIAKNFLLFLFFTLFLTLLL